MCTRIEIGKLVSAKELLVSSGQGRTQGQFQISLVSTDAAPTLFLCPSEFTGA